MRNLSQIVAALLIMSAFLFGQKSPHGEKFNMKCSNFHKTDNWKVDLQNVKFDHSNTGFSLVGQHKTIRCGLCHKQLKFSGTPKKCADCHKDVHQNSVGFDCARCHTPNVWVVTNIMGIHENGRFPLSGAHQTVDCYQCHKTESQLNFEPIGVDCFQCHKAQYFATNNPNHIQLGLGTNCEECHSLFTSSWGSAGFVHGFFPLRGGHAISDCSVCHAANTYKGLDPDCNSCHNANYLSTTNPNHISVQFSTDCAFCHSIDGWRPADYKEHDALYFKIYSGTHEGEWDVCSDCHTSPSNYSTYSCLKCHDSNNGGD